MAAESPGASTISFAARLRAFAGSARALARFGAVLAAKQGIEQGAGS
jgi:hypothetical protein